MAQFSTNQVRHVYVANSLKSNAAGVTALGDLAVIQAKDHNGTATKGFYLLTKGYGGLTRSDIVEEGKIEYVTSTAAAKMAHKKKQYTLSLANESSLWSSNAVTEKFANQDILVRMYFKQYISIGEEDTYQKYGVVHTYTGMTKAKFMDTLYNSLVANMSREDDKMVEFELTGKSQAGAATNSSTIVIKEKEPDWVLGVRQQAWTNFEVTASKAEIDGAEVNVFTTDANLFIPSDFNGGTVSNSKVIADLEYFAMGDRADLYRNLGWPNVRPSKLLVDPEAANGYDLVDIVYYFSGPVEDVQRSRKQMTIVAPAGSGAAIKTAIDAIINPAPQGGGN